MTGRKMSGKYCCEVHFNDPDCPCTKRIAELEAELRNWKELGPLPCSDWLDRKVAAELRAEKAEVEVERLRFVCESQNRLIEVMGGESAG